MRDCSATRQLPQDHSSWTRRKHLFSSAVEIERLNPPYFALFRSASDARARSIPLASKDSAFTPTGSRIQSETFTHTLVPFGRVPLPQPVSGARQWRQKLYCRVFNRFVDVAIKGKTRPRSQLQLKPAEATIGLLILRRFQKKRPTPDRPRRECPRAICRSWCQLCHGAPSAPCPP